MMNSSQAKFVSLIEELNLKAKEYNKFCDKLEQLKQTDINPNDEEVLKLKQLFQKNRDEIVEINRQLKELKENEELLEKQKLEQYNPENLFKRNNNISENKKEENMNILVVENKKNIFIRLIEKIKEIFSMKK